MHTLTRTLQQSKATPSNNEQCMVFDRSMLEGTTYLVCGIEPLIWKPRVLRGSSYEMVRSGSHVLYANIG